MENVQIDTAKTGWLGLSRLIKCRRQTRIALRGGGLSITPPVFLCADSFSRTVAPSVVHHQLSSRFHLVARSRRCCSSPLAAVFFLAFFICSQSGDQPLQRPRKSGEQPKEYLAKSGYEPEINDKSLIILLCVLASDFFFSKFRCCVLG